MPQAIYKWLKNPSTWISVLALGFSLFSFYYVYARRGTIEVLLAPDIMIGPGMSTGKLTLAVPATFGNTGSPHTRYHIRSIKGFARSLDATVGLEGDIRWTYERKFVGRDEYFHRYPEKEDKGHEDYLDYVGRASPFSIEGGGAVMKVIELEMDKVFSGSPPARISVEMVITTAGGKSFSGKNVYKCPKEGLKRGDGTWCQEEPIKSDVVK